MSLLLVFLTLLTILVLECVLSIDNAAVLATIVAKSGLSTTDQNKSLKYGILGAYLFRGLGISLAGFLILNPQIGGIMKILGGLYLCYLFYTHLTPEQDSTEEGDTSSIDKFIRFLHIDKLSNFAKTIIQVEIADFVFSIDNIFACVAMSNNLLIIIVAVFIAILLMRYVTQMFAKLIVKFPDLEKSAFIVIFLLGLKLIVSGLADSISSLHLVKEIMGEHIFDFGFSILTMSIFFFPIIFKRKETPIENGFLDLN